MMLVLLNIVIASPGRLDSNGCHTSKTEGYHCHRSQVSSSSSQSSTMPNTQTNFQEPVKKGLNYVCSTNSECSSNYCIHSVCRNNSYFIEDNYCDNGETCLNSPKDCGSCVNNGKCDVEVNESCANSNDCACKDNQICSTERPNKQSSGCYDIRCGDSYVDKGETVDNCCLDIKCHDTKSLIKESFCNQNTKGCDTRIKNWLKISGGIIAVFFALLIYNHMSIKKTYRNK